jgi:hypothetical protein
MDFTYTDPIVIDPDVNSESEKEAIKKLTIDRGCTLTQKK